MPSLFKHFYKVPQSYS